MHGSHQGPICTRALGQRMMVRPRGYLTTWADGNPRLAPEMGLDSVCHGPPDPSPMHFARTTHLHPKIAEIIIQAINGPMGASAQVMDQESWRNHLETDHGMAMQASPTPQPRHCPKTLCPSHSHATKSNHCTPSPCPDSNRGTTTGTSLFRHRLTFHWNRQPVLSLHLPRHC